MLRRTTRSPSPERPPPVRGHCSPRRAAGIGVLAAAVLGLGCEISPVVSAQEPPSGRYPDCERAAESYCEFVVEAKEREMERCVADHLYQCIAGTGR